MSDNRAIGVFDSGLGGLTTVRQLRRLAPSRSIVYFGDTGRVPYGSRSPETILKYSKQDIAVLLRHNVRLVIAACGTASSTLPAEYTDRLPVPYLNVIAPTADAAVKATGSGKIGIIGTNATVSSHSFRKAVERIMPSAKVFEQACPLFVPLVENGFIERDNEITRLTAKKYLAPLLESDIDTLILGCTHYPIIEAIIKDIAGEGVTLIDSGLEAARAAVALLGEDDGNDTADEKFYVSDSGFGFAPLAEMLLGENLDGKVEKIDINAVAPYEV